MDFLQLVRYLWWSQLGVPIFGVNTIYNCWYISEPNRMKFVFLMTVRNKSWSDCAAKSMCYSHIYPKYSDTLTLKTPRKTASENVICLCCLLNILANFSNLFLHTGKLWTQIRLLLEEQSDLGPHCLQNWLLKSQADDKADDYCRDWQFKG